MKHKKVFVSLISDYAKYLGEQSTEVTSNLLLKMLQYYTISHILYGVAVVLLCLLVSVFAYQKIKNHCKKG